MYKNQERDFEALDYGKFQKAKLTAKQYLVYSYLMSISKWDSQTRESHYYVYKNSFLIKDACKLIGISQPTWRTAISKLKEHFYIQEFDKYYTIEIPNTYAPLNIELIRYLLPFGKNIQNGGNIISVYSVIYKYWKYQTDNNEECEITMNQLRKLFTDQRHANEIEPYKLMISLFEFSGLIFLEKQKRKFKGQEYMAYIIHNVRLDMPKNYIPDENGPEDIDSIIAALTVNVKKEERELNKIA